MKIVDLKIYTLYTELSEPFEWPTGQAFGRACGVIKLITDTGIVGWGPGPDNMKAYEAKIRKVVIGQDPERTGVIARDLKLGGWGNVAKPVQGAVDIALWDIKGKIQGKPIYELLGGALRDKIPTYSTVGYYPVPNDTLDLEWLKGQMQPRIDMGFRVFKMKIGGRSFADDLKRIDTVLEMLGPERRLAVDATTGYTYEDARIMGRELDARNILWFEDPVAMEDIHSFEKLNTELLTPVTSHYAGDFNPDLCDELIRMRAVAKVHPSIEGVGGFTSAMPMIGKSSLQGILFEPSCWSTHLHMLATIHLLAVIPPLNLRMKDLCTRLEWDSTLNPLRSDSLLKSPLCICAQDGTIALPTAPGLGIEIDEEKLEKYSCDS